MTTEENKATFRRILDEVFNKGNLMAAADLVDVDIIDHNRPPGMPPGIEGVKAKVQMIRTAFPDAHWTLEDQVAEGDKVASRFTLRGTHRGPWRGIAPTEKQIMVTGMDLVRFQDGKVVEYWGQTDLLSIMQQLGALPAPAQATG